MPSYSVQISSRPINGEHLEDPRFHCHYPHLGPAQINGEPLRGARAIGRSGSPPATRSNVA